MSDHGQSSSSFFDQGASGSLDMSYVERESAGEKEKGKQVLREGFEKRGEDGMDCSESGSNWLREGLKTPLERIPWTSRT